MLRQALFLVQYILVAEGKGRDITWMLQGELDQGAIESKIAQGPKIETPLIPRYQQYKLQEQTLTSRRALLEQKIPELKRNLAIVNKLQEQKEAEKVRPCLGYRRKSLSFCSSLSQGSQAQAIDARN